MTAVSTVTTAARRYKRILLIAVGALQVAAGGVTAVAPHLATILGPRPFAIAMIVTGIGSAVLAFVKAEVQQEE
jgi:uncharacterized membrane protein HdeD (DUF308 family)